MHFLLIRHGQPQWAIDGIAQHDPGLTTLGQEQAALVAQNLSSARPTITDILVSSATRSQQTAAPLIDATGMAPITAHDIREIAAPDWEGLREEEVQDIFKKARQEPPAAWWAGLPGGEPFTDFRARVVAEMDVVLERHGITAHTQDHPHLWDSSGDDECVAIVAHAGTNSVIITHLLGMEPTPWEWERLRLGHTSVVHLRAIPLAGAHAFAMTRFNDLEHLPKDMRTY